MSTAPFMFSAAGTVQLFLVPATGGYFIEAAGAQGGSGRGPGAKGDRIKGLFYLKRGDVVKIVAGRQGIPACPPHQLVGSKGGDSLVWFGSSALPSPVRLMLAAYGGRGGDADGREGMIDGLEDGGPSDHIRATGSQGGRSPGQKPDWLRCDITETVSVRRVIDGLRGAGGEAEARDLSELGGGSYNAGAFQVNLWGVQTGEGYVSITAAMPAGPGPGHDAGGLPGRSTAQPAIEQRESGRTQADSRASRPIFGLNLVASPRPTAA